MNNATKPLVDRAQIESAQLARTAAWGRALAALIVIAFVAVIGRVVQLKVNPDPRLAPASGATFSSETHLMRRGDLVDRRGRVVASDTVGRRLFIDPQTATDLDTIAVDIAHLIHADPIEIDRKIAERPNSRYVVIDDQLDSWQIDAIRQAQLPGVGLTPILQRHYPAGDVGERMVGLVGYEHTGLSGYEMTFNDELAPQPGRMKYLRDSRRRPLWIEPTEYHPGVEGRDIQLSLDMFVQNIVEQRLSEAVERLNAGGGRMVVMDCRTGELLAMSDILRTPSDREALTEDPLRKTHPALGRNRCVTDAYEPGSTFKPFIWAAATELGVADPDEMLDCPEHTGMRTSQGRFIRDSHYYGRSSWRKVLIKSMNSGMSMIAERLTERQMQNIIANFGFGKKTRCGLPGETPGIVTDAKQWNHYTQTSVSMGHEIAVTPLQMVRAFSAFARDGTIVPIRLTASRRGDESFQMLQRVMSPEIARLTRETLLEVIEGRPIASKKYRIFGKSGTAQLVKKEGGGYHEDRYISSFIAAAPLDEPRIIALCVIDDPERAIGHWGSETAGPVVRDVVDSVLTYLGVPSDRMSEATDHETIVSAAE